MGDELERLLAWEDRARKTIAESAAHARTLRDEAERRRLERLTLAKREAGEAAAEAHMRLMAEAEKDGRVSRTQAEMAAERIRAAARDRLDAVAQAALRWLVGGGSQP